MATNFHANQYEDAFIPPRLQNWEVPKQRKGTVPKPQEGFTEITASDRGHILDGYPRSAKNPWGDFIGTWDFPKQIPGNCATVVTARRDGSEDKLRRHLLDAKKVMTGAVKNEQRQLKGAKAPITLPGPPQATHLLEEEKMPTPTSDLRRSGAEAPIPATTSPEKVPSACQSGSPALARTSRPCSTGSVEYVQVNAL